MIGVPSPGTEVADADAVVVALKSRIIPAPEAPLTPSAFPVLSIATFRPEFQPPWIDQRM
jgi:hypothetical protein